MSFDELYDSHFRNIQLRQMPLAQSKKPDPHPSVSLDSVFSSSRFVCFFLCSGARGGDIAVRLDQMAKQRNNDNSEKAQSSPARIRRLFSLKKKKKRDVGDSINVSIVLFDTDHRSTAESSMSFAQPGWFVYSPESPAAKSRLLRSLSFEFPPSVAVVDTLSRSIVTTEGRRLLNEDPLGNTFPWYPPSPADLLTGPVVRRVNGETKSFEFGEVKAQIRALFFGALWCPPCRQWAKQLAPVYDSLISNGISIEIIYCSSDRSQEFFNQFMDQMPWTAFAYNTAKTIQLTRLFNIGGIPSLILIDESGNVISRHGRPALLSDPMGRQFPWTNRPLYELDEHSYVRIRDEPSLILFTEGSPDDISFSLSVLDPLSKRLSEDRLRADESRAREREEWRERREDRENRHGGNMEKSNSSEECSSASSADSVPLAVSDPLQIFFTGEDPICDHILETILGLEEAELPLICIVDWLAGQFSICENPDVSEEVLDDFVNEYRGGALKWIPLPPSPEGARTVGGIPMSMIEQALITSSPSQNSVGNEEAKTA